MNYEDFTMADPETQTDVDIPHLFLTQKESWSSAIFLFFNDQICYQNKKQHRHYRLVIIMVLFFFFMQIYSSIHL